MDGYTKRRTDGVDTKLDNQETTFPLYSTSIIFFLNVRDGQTDRLKDGRTDRQSEIYRTYGPKITSSIKYRNIHLHSCAWGVNNNVL